MDTKTKDLLGQCVIGCKMAVDSLEQMMEHTENQYLSELLEEYKQKHEQIRDDAEEQLDRENPREEEPEPNGMVSGFSWLTSETKLNWSGGDEHTIAKMAMDGCNMGIQTISEYVNANSQASKESVFLAKDLIRTEEEFLQKLKNYL